MAHFNEQHASEFIRLLTGDANSVVTFQLYYDPKDGQKRPDLARHFNAKISQTIPAIERAETSLQGVYICINETDGKGRYASNIKRIRALFADFDGMQEPDWLITPHFVTQRDDTHGHAYWLVDDVEVEEFSYLQKRISIAHSTDWQVVDPSRVARLPGTLHLKDPTNPKVYYVTKNNGIPYKYTKRQIIDGFALSPEQQAEYDKWVTTREAKTEGEGFDNNKHAIDKVVRFFAERAEPAVEGAGSNTLYKVSSYAYDQGLTLELAQDLAWEHYNPRCIPPWDETERQHFDDTIKNAYNYAHNAPGCRSAVTVFKEAGDIPPPPPKPLKHDIIRLGDRVSKSDAEILNSQYGNSKKSEHYTLAQIFDGMIYDGTNLIRCQKIFYLFNGRVWELIDDDVIRSQVQRFYSHLKPADALVNGIFNCLKDMVNVKFIENGIWLDSGQPTGDIACFDNGLVNLQNGNAKVMEHTPNFFSFNELGYDYSPSAQCPEWTKFLRDVFEHDPELILQLQEWFGYCLVADNSMEKFATLIGESRAGKGVITTCLANVVGWGNTVSPPLGKLNQDSMLHSMSSASLALIPDAHSVHASKRDEVLVNFKSITGNDPMSFHVLYKGVQTSLFKVRFVLSTNNMPEFNDPTGALVNRMLVFTFVKSFADNPDTTLKDRLKAETPGIAQWALQGLRRLRKQGYFTEAKSGKVKKEQIKDDMNPIAEFINDMCVIGDEEAFVTVNQLTSVYRLYCKQNFIDHPLTGKKLSRYLTDSGLGIQHERRRVGEARPYGFKGLSLVNKQFSTPD